jgi:site-specific DNA-adenine methylase
MFCFLSENYNIKKVYLNDLDEYLVNFFNIIKTDGSNFLKEYSKLLKKDKAKQFEICKINLENSPPFYFFLKEHSFNSINVLKLNSCIKTINR